MSASTVPSGPPATEAAARTFVVKLRDMRTRSWGDQTEVVAASALAAAEGLAGEPLLAAPGERANLRARVWATPFGSQPDIAFYAVASTDAA